MYIFMNIYIHIYIYIYLSLALEKWRWHEDIRFQNQPQGSRGLRLTLALPRPIIAGVLLLLTHYFNWRNLNRFFYTGCKCYWWGSLRDTSTMTTIRSANAAMVATTKTTVVNCSLITSTTIRRTQWRRTTTLSISSL